MHRSLLTRAGLTISLALCFCVVAGVIFHDRAAGVRHVWNRLAFAWEERFGEDEDRPPNIRLTAAELRHTRWSQLDDVGTNHRCNQDVTSAPQNETPCAASPLNPDVIIVGANDHRDLDSWGAGFYRTTDGGLTWSDALFTHGAYGNAADPVICADSTGRFYASYIAYDANLTNMRVTTQTSTDNGVTWSTQVVSSGQDMADKPFAACDISAESPYRNNFYVAWVDYGDGSIIHFARSTNHGASFSTPILISAGFGQFPCPTVGPNGEVYLVWTDPSAATIQFDHSTDGGVTWSGNRTVAPFSETHGDGGGCGSFRSPLYPVIACDITSGPHRGALYVCWADDHRDNDPDIVFCRSTDGGTTWSAPVTVNDDSTNHWQWWPWIAVHPQTGEIGMSWMDRREDPQNCRYSCWGTVSTDGGDTWARNFRISDQLNDPSNVTFLGDYAGTTFSRQGFFSTWPDLRNDGGDIYGAWWNNDSLRVPPRVTAYRSGNDIRLGWQSTGAPHYRIYSADSLNGPFTTLEGTTTGTVFMDAGAAAQPVKFYIVRASTEP